MSGGDEVETKGFKSTQDTHCLILIFFFFFLALILTKQMPKQEKRVKEETGGEKKGVGRPPSWNSCLAAVPMR